MDFETTTKGRMIQTKKIDFFVLKKLSYREGRLR